MEPISMLVLAAISLLGGAATAGVVYTVLALPEVRAWFEARRSTIVADPDLVATTVVDLMASGSYRTVQGVFNTRTRTWLDYRTIDSDRLGADLAWLHRNHRVVFHTL